MQSELLAAVRDPLMRRNKETDTVSAILFLRQRQQLPQSKNRIAIFGTAAAQTTEQKMQRFRRMLQQLRITKKHGHS